MGEPKRRPLRGLPIVPLVTIAVLAVLWQAIRLMAGDPDERAIAFERWKRFTSYSAGYRLPGTPDLTRLDARLLEKGLKRGEPIFIRVFKREFELELWILRDGRFELFSTYPICRYSGRLGPKLRQGDRQAPEGFYTVDGSQLNPKSRWHRSFNLGFPNAFDRAFGRTGSALMVHGGCSSVGCYAMTNAVIDEIWTLVTAALAGGQPRFQVQVLPFRLTEENLRERSRHAEAGFWRNLKEGYDVFDADRRPPKVAVCGKRYTFETAAGAADGSTPITNRCFKRKSAG